MRAIAITVLVVVIAWFVPAHGAPPGKRVLAVELPQELFDAVETALAAWQVEIVRRRAAVGASMPSAAVNARGLAQQEDVTAVVWLSKTADGDALWVYDRKSDRAVARPLLTTPPFDDATAADVALAVKTLLRHTLAAPVIERYGPNDPKATVPPPSRPARFSVSSRSGVRFRGAGGGPAELRLALGAAFRPLRWMQFRGQLSVGRGASVEDDGFVGRFGDTAISLAPVLLWVIADRIRVEPYLGVSVHLTSVDGAVVGQAAGAQVARANTSLDGGASVFVAVAPRLRLGVYVESASALRRQRYLVRGTPVLTLPRIEWEAGLVLALPL